MCIAQIQHVECICLPQLYIENCLHKFEEDQDGGLCVGRSAQAHRLAESPLSNGEGYQQPGPSSGPARPSPSQGDHPPLMMPALLAIADRRALCALAASLCVCACRCVCKHVLSFTCGPATVGTTLLCTCARAASM
jgi:hypothetical protein